MFGLGTTELLIIFAILVVLLGAKRLPKLGRSIGDAVASFKKETKRDGQLGG